MNDLPTIIIIGVFVGLFALMLVKRALIRRSVNTDFIAALGLFEMKCATTSLRKSLSALPHLSKLKGFESIDTLLLHRHRARAAVRLKKLQEEWNKQEFKIYRRKT